MGRAYVGTNGIPRTIRSGIGREERELDIPESWISGVTRSQRCDYYRDHANRGEHPERAYIVGDTPVFVLPARHARIMTLLLACRGRPPTARLQGVTRGLGTRLEHLNGQRQTKLDESVAFFAGLRAIAALSHLIADHGSNRTVPGFERTVSSDWRLRGHARDLKEQLDRGGAWMSDPMAVTHGRYLDEVERESGLLLSILSDQQYADAVAEFVDDTANIGPQIMNTYVRVLFSSVSMASQQLAQTVHFAQGPSGNTRDGVGGLTFASLLAARNIERTLLRDHPNLARGTRAQRLQELRQMSFREALQNERQGDSGNAICALVTASTVFTNVFGNAPAGDALMMGLAKVATTRIIAVQSTRRVLNTNVLVTLEDFVLRDVRDHAHRNAVRDALRNPSNENTQAAHDALGAGFQTGHRLNGAITACCVLQLAWTVYQANAGEGAERDVDAGETASIVEAGFGAGSSIVTFMSRGPLPVRSVTAAFQQLDDIVARVSTPVIGFFAVVSIGRGLWDLSVAIEERDRSDAWSAGLSAASGAFIAAGVFFGIPGAQPIGVVLGIVATAVGLLGWVYDVTRPPLAAEALKLLHLVNASRDRGVHFIDVPELAQIKTIYDQLKDRIEYHHNNAERLYFPGHYSDRRVRDAFHQARAELRAIGYRTRPRGRRREEDTVYVQDLVFSPQGCLLL